MQDAAHLKWLATFDIEPLISGILRNGMLLCAGLAITSLAFQWMGTGSVFLPPLQAKSLPSLILVDFRYLNSSGVNSSVAWSRLLVDLSIGVLMLTPYVRLLVSLMYAMWVERNWQHALFTGSVLTILTTLVLTDVM